jgi:hypothetical protein
MPHTHAHVPPFLGDHTAAYTLYSGCLLRVASASCFGCCWFLLLLWLGAPHRVQVASTTSSLLLPSVSNRCWDSVPMALLNFGCWRLPLIHYEVHQPILLHDGRDSLQYPCHCSCLNPRGYATLYGPKRVTSAASIRCISCGLAINLPRAGLVWAEAMHCCWSLVLLEVLLPVTLGPKLLLILALTLLAYLQPLLPLFHSPIWYLHPLPCGAFYKHDGKRQIRRTS